MVEKVGKLKGPFRGFRNQETRFTFLDGSIWRQSESKYLYFYAHSPRARVMYDNGQYVLEVDGTDETVRVERETTIQKPLNRTKRIARVA